ncbi:MAG: hypothetical protein HY692_02335 [Cyanobacteria bacterium NC_groundwater_1444_Ag_S-0.65um_54_12]|nr:hypothetical protein [Cyanobacteria bacterium NC_groundwater_1444_Ag_S-0.65um_54_12]
MGVTARAGQVGQGNNSGRNFMYANSNNDPVYAGSAIMLQGFGPGIGPSVAIEYQATHNLKWGVEVGYLRFVPIKNWSATAEDIVTNKRYDLDMARFSGTSPAPVDASGFNLTLGGILSF